MTHSTPVIYFGSSASNFGTCYVAWINERICKLAFCSSESDFVAALRKQFQLATFQENSEQAALYIKQIFDENSMPDLYLKGTDFQLQVWGVLAKIPKGTTSTYSQVAAHAGYPKAIRATGTAIGANPIAYLIPCHRVIRNNGSLGGYRWGLELKKKMLHFENIQTD